MAKDGVVGNILLIMVMGLEKRSRVQGAGQEKGNLTMGSCPDVVEVGQQMENVRPVSIAPRAEELPETPMCRSSIGKSRGTNELLNVPFRLRARRDTDTSNSRGFPKVCFEQ